MLQLPGRTDAELVIVLDCADLDRLADFWSAVLGYERSPVGDPYCQVLELGATRLTADPVEESGWTWHVLADPEGNEFCLLHPPEA